MEVNPATLIGRTSWPLTQHLNFPFRDLRFPPSRQLFLDDLSGLELILSAALCGIGPRKPPRHVRFMIDPICATPYLFSCPSRPRFLRRRLSRNLTPCHEKVLVPRPVLADWPPVDHSVTRLLLSLGASNSDSPCLDTRASY